MRTLALTLVCYAALSGCGKSTQFNAAGKQSRSPEMSASDSTQVEPSKVEKPENKIASEASEQIISGTHTFESAHAEKIGFNSPPSVREDVSPVSTPDVIATPDITA